MGARRNRSAELVDWDPRDWRSGGSTAAWTMLPAAVLAGLLCLGAIVATALEAAADPEAAAAQGRACRWEVVAGTPWRDAPGGGPAQPVTLLLDQCSGQTWTLILAQGGFEWRPVRREPDWAVFPGRP